MSKTWVGDLFTLDAGTKGINKDIFIDTVSHMPDGEIVAISPFTDYLRGKGATSSESTVERYIRWAKDWFINIRFESLGKGKYQLKREG